MSVDDLLLNKIKSFKGNSKVLEYFGDGCKSNELIPIHAKNFYTHEVLEDFLSLDLPSETKYILNNHGIFVNPNSGEIFAFQFGRSEVIFKRNLASIDLGSLPRLRRTLFRFYNIRGLFKLRLNYFSNIYGDHIIDMKFLGKKWALSIYFTTRLEEKIQDYYRSIRN